MQELPKIITLVLFLKKYDILFCLVVIMQNKFLISCVLSNIALSIQINVFGRAAAQCTHI